MQSEFFGFIGNPLKFYTISTNNVCYTHITYYARRNERTMPREPSPLQAFGFMENELNGMAGWVGLMWIGMKMRVTGYCVYAENTILFPFPFQQ